MKGRIIIKREDEVLYSGPVLEIPIKKEVIDKMSLEVFGDGDPCVIHQSFIIKEIVSNLIDLFKISETDILQGSKYKKDLDFLNFENINELTIELMG